MLMILLSSIFIACGDKDEDTAVEETEVTDSAEQTPEDTGAAEDPEEETEEGSEESTGEEQIVLDFQKSNPEI